MNNAINKQKITTDVRTGYNVIRYNLFFPINERIDRGRHFSPSTFYPDLFLRQFNARYVHDAGHDIRHDHWG